MPTTQWLHTGPTPNKHKGIGLKSQIYNIWKVRGPAQRLATTEPESETLNLAVAIQPSASPSPSSVPKLYISE